MPVVEPATPVVEPAMPVVEPATPVVEPTMPVVEQATPVVETAPVVEQLVTPTVQAAPQPVIYGGASPVVQDLNFQQNSTHQIYGGANPLENTQSIPIMETQASQPVVTAPQQDVPVMQPVTQQIQ